MEVLFGLFFKMEYDDWRNDDNVGADGDFIDTILLYLVFFVFFGN